MSNDVEVQGMGGRGERDHQLCLRAGGGGESFTEKVQQTEFLALVIAPHPQPFSVLSTAAGEICYKSDQVIAGFKILQWLPVSLRVEAKVLRQSTGPL